MTRTSRLLALLTALGLMFAGVLTGCSSSPALVDYPPPQVLTVTVGAQCYVGYQYNDYEADVLGVPTTCTRMIYPSYRPPLTSSPEYALWIHLLTYDSFYHSGYYYDQFLAPGAATHHVVIVNKTSYINTTTSFDREHSAEIKADSAKATWKGGQTGAYKFPNTNQNSRTKPATAGTPAPKRDTSNVGSDNSNSRRNTPARPAAGKPGTKR